MAEHAFVLIAMDRSARTLDADGRLHLQVSNISKANVCPYYGSEIPNFEEMELDPNRVYNLLRAPEELEKAAATFNNLPILSEHVAVSAENHRPEIVVGSSGTDADFDGTYLTNSLVIWASDAIAGVMADSKREISCAYYYTPVMEPGVFDGLPYDGKMTNIIGNHIALVIEGRAGPDVLVGDEQMKLTSRKALMLSGALIGLVRPKLAKDAKLALDSALTGVTAKNMAKDKAKIAAKVVKLVDGKLATDATITVEDVTIAIDSVIGIAMDEEKDEIGEDAEMDAEDDDIDEPTGDEADCDAKDEDMDAEDGDADVALPVGKAMDTKTVRALIADAVSKTEKKSKAIEIARDAVFPHIGRVAAMDSASDIYKLALDAAGVDLTGIDKSHYGAMVAMLDRAKPRGPAHDRAPTSKLASVVSNLPPVKRV